jgi:hypothetical protein
VKITAIVRQNITLVRVVEMELTPDTAPEYFRHTAVETFQEGKLGMLTSEAGEEYDYAASGDIEVEYRDEAGHEIEDLNTLVVKVTLEAEAD